MLGAVIRYGKNTLVVELPTGTMDLQSKLSSIGIQNLPEDILLADEDSNPIRVKLYAGSPEEAHLLTLLTPERSLADANGSMIVLNHSAPEIQSHLRYGLIADRYSSLDGYLDEAKQLLQNKWEPAKNEETKENPKLADALQLYESNPNIRLVVAAAYDGETEVFALPLSERDCSAAFMKLDEHGADAVFKIEACRYGRPWDEIFDTVLQKEGLHALNAFATAFPYMEDLQTYEAVIEYAGVTDSKSLICLADHIDEFEFYSITEIATDDGYVLLTDPIEVKFSYVLVRASGNMRVLADINDTPVSLLADNGSVNAVIPMTVVNTKGFDLPQTGDNGVWRYSVYGILLMAASAAVVIVLVTRRKKSAQSK